MLLQTQLTVPSEKDQQLQLQDYKLQAEAASQKLRKDKLDCEQQLNGRIAELEAQLLAAQQQAEAQLQELNGGVPLVLRRTASEKYRMHQARLLQDAGNIKVHAQTNKLHLSANCVLGEYRWNEKAERKTGSCRANHTT